MTPTEQDIAALHAEYLRVTGLHERQVWCESLWKTLLQDYGFDAARLKADVAHAARYLHRRIAAGARNDEALVARNFLRLESFTELVSLAKAKAPSLAPVAAKPKAATPEPPALDDAARKRVAEQLRGFLEQMKNGA